MALSLFLPDILSNLDSKHSFLVDPELNRHVVDQDDQLSLRNRLSRLLNGWRRRFEKVFPAGMPTPADVLEHQGVQMRMSHFIYALIIQRQYRIHLLKKRESKRN